MIPLWDQGQCHLLMIQSRDLLYRGVRALGVSNGIWLRAKHSNSDLLHRKEPIAYASCSSLEKAPAYVELVGLSC